MKTENGCIYFCVMKELRYKIRKAPKLWCVNYNSRCNEITEHFLNYKYLLT